MEKKIKARLREYGCPDSYIENEVKWWKSLYLAALPKEKEIEDNFEVTADGGIDIDIDEKDVEGTGDKLVHLAKFADATGYNQALEEVKRMLK